MYMVGHSEAYLQQEPAELFEGLHQALVSDLPDDQHVRRRLGPGEPLAGRVLYMPSGRTHQKVKNTHKHASPEYASGSDYSFKRHSYVLLPAKWPCVVMYM